MELARKKQVKTFAAQIRIETLKALGHLGFGHLGGSLSIADLLAVLYSGEMKIDPADPDWEDRDFLICSKGHAGPGIYATLALKGYFPMEQLLTINQGGTHLPSHCDHNLTPGIDMTTGSLGQGSSLAVGVALGKRIQQKEENYTYLILGDGEIQEGQVWEAMMFASHYHLDNLCVIIDNNGLQIDGAVDKVMSPYPIDEKLKAFGFHVICINGNDMADIDRAMQEAKTVKGQPTAILMKTTKGKGVSYMEGKAEWHGKAPNDEQYELGLAELRSALSELEGK